MSVVAHWMQTHGGRKFFPSDPKSADVDLLDIAHALSRICRFGGHSEQHYSVAQHSVLVCSIVESLGGTLGEIRYGLLHDAAEAYVGDVVWPLKQAPEMAGYKMIERRVEEAIARRFELDLEMPGIVKHADLVALATEKRDIMGHADGYSAGVERQATLARLGEWHCDTVKPLERRIVPRHAGAAREMFKGRAFDLGLLK